MARLTSLSGLPRTKKLGLLKGKLKIPDDFNARLDEATISEFEGQLIPAGSRVRVEHPGGRSRTRARQ
jgi:hypothetical protein